MKTRILIALIAALVFGFRAEAQICVQQISSGKQIIIGNTLPSGNINTLFGVPQKVRSHEDDAAGGFMTVFIYEGFTFSTVDGLVYDLSFSSKDFIVIIHGKYKVKVGDKLSTFLTSIPAGETNRSIYNNVTAIRFKIENTNVMNEEALMLNVNSQGFITVIGWHSPV